MMPHPQNTEDPDQQIDSTIIKLAEDYASCDRRSAEINDERKTIRDNAEKLGIPSKAFQHAVGMVKHMSEGERRDYTVGMNRVVRAIEGRQQELFPAEAERIRKRQDNAAAKKAGKPRSEDELNQQTDTSERSDPNAGGAKPEVGQKANPPKTLAEATKQSDAAIAESLKAIEGGNGGATAPKLTVVGTDAGEMKQPEGVAQTPPPPPADDEQAAGEKALNDGLPMSQSAQAAAKREAAKLN